MLRLCLVKTRRKDGCDAEGEEDLMQVLKRTRAELEGYKERL